MLLVEQNVTFASTVADRHYLLAQGRVVESLDNDEFRARARASCSTTSACEPHPTTTAPRRTTATPPVHRTTAPWETA